MPSKRPRQRNDIFPPLVMEVDGDFACFTRPEHKGERVSYPMMTPTAAQGVLEAVFWKPEFAYRIVKIEVLKPIRWFGLRRNEVSVVPALSAVNAKGNRYRFDATAHRDQRHTLALRDVAYRIHAKVRLKPRAEAPVEKYREQFRRRLDRGACFSHPFLGSREFSCTAFGPPDYTRTPIEETLDLGSMVLDVDHDARPHQFTWFTAMMVKGTLHVPDEGIRIPAAPVVAREPRIQGAG